eukprot:6188030-Pleurochrysis_carterae.AAC.1
MPCIAVAWGWANKGCLAWHSPHQPRQQQHERVGVGVGGRHGDARPARLGDLERGTARRRTITGCGELTMGRRNAQGYFTQ